MHINQLFVPSAEHSGIALSPMINARLLFKTNPGVSRRIKERILAFQQNMGYIILYVSISNTKWCKVQEMKQTTQHVFIAGAKSLGAYGGYETFLDKLTEYHQNTSAIQYHIACKANGEGAMDESLLPGVSDVRRRADGSTAEFTFHNARCVKIPVPNIGAAQAVYYDLASLWNFCRYIKHHRIPHPVVYILACRIGFFAPFVYRAVRRLGGKLYINPDGHEWMRSKWNRLIRKYWKYSEKVMVRNSDLVICDSQNIETYIHECYDGKCRGKGDPKTTYISYGAEIPKSSLQKEAIQNWCAQTGLPSGEYYLIVGRFVPENNYETMIREFMASQTKRSLVIICNENEKFRQELERKLQFSKDPRIRLVGSVYDKALLSAIRQNAYAYLHGHEVGGTNPSLLEALGATRLNLLLDVSFNREVAADSALYWTKEPDSLSNLIDTCDAMAPKKAADLKIFYLS